jgi:hypothetical protein
MAFMAPAMPFLALAGAGVSAVGAIEQGQATAAAARYQAQVARNNAQIANQNAEYSVQSGLRKTEQASLKGAALYGKAKASLAANGVDVNTGSANDVLTSERETNKLDAETVLSNAQLQAYGYRTNATSYQAQAGLDEATAEQAPIGAAFKAAGGLLSSASAVGGGFGAGGGGGFASGASSIASGNAGSWVNPDIPFYAPDSI